MMHRSVIDALSTFYAVMVVTLFVPLLAGLYARHTSRRQGLASLVGVPVLAIVHFSTAGAGYGALTPTVSGVLVSALAFCCHPTSGSRLRALEATDHTDQHGLRDPVRVPIR